MSYTRVIPRDFFNESKLLKCMGRVAIILHEYARMAELLHLVHLTTDHGYSEGFDIEQADDGDLFVSNVVFARRGSSATFHLYCGYNAKGSEFPLHAYDSDGGIITVLNDDGGRFTAEFIAFLEGV